MSPMRRVSGLSAAVIGALALASSAHAAAPEMAFDGRCDVYGEVTFRDRVTTEVTENPFVFSTADRLTTCAGALRIGDETLRSRTRPVRVTVSGSGQVSCQNSTAEGLRGRLVFLRRGKGDTFRPLRVEGRRVRLRTTVSLEHVLNSVVASVSGAEETAAEARATFFPTPEAIERCGEDGIRSLPFNGTIVTQNELISK
jgi:hypothetical protein